MIDRVPAGIRTDSGRNLSGVTRYPTDRPSDRPVPALTSVSYSSLRDMSAAAG